MLRLNTRLSLKSTLNTKQIWMLFNLPMNQIGKCDTKCAPLSSPHMTLANLPIEYDSDLKVMWCRFTICWREFTMNKKFGATHQHVFYMLKASCSLAKTYKDGVTLCMHPTSSQSHMAIYTTFDLLHEKCNMMSFDKSLWKFSLKCINLHGNS